MCSRFQCIFLRYHEASFPVIYTDYRSNDNWFTKGIKISCTKKRELYSILKNKDNTQIRDYYKKYRNVPKRKQYFHIQVATSSNKVKAAWKIIKKKL